MITMIIVDYKSLKKTFEYVVSFIKNINDSADVNILIIENNENVFENLKELFDLIEAMDNIEKISCYNVDVYKFWLNSKAVYFANSGSNLGYAKGNNFGVNIAKELFNDKYYLFSNNDIVFEKKFNIKTLIKPMEMHKDVAAVGPSIIGVDGKEQTPRKRVSANRQLFLYYYNLLLPPKLKIPDYFFDLDLSESSKACYWVTGSFFIVFADAFNKVNGFDEGTFLYCEEMILAEKLIKLGYSMYYEKEICLIHEHGGTTKENLKIVNAIKISFESSVYYYKKYRNLSEIKIYLARVNFLLFIVLFKIKKSITNKNKGI